MSSYDAVKSIIYSEKSNDLLTKHNKHTIKISKNINKKQLKDFILKEFGLEVIKVNICNYNGKIKKFKSIEGKRPSFKKAVITLKNGDDLNFQNIDS